MSRFIRNSGFYLILFLVVVGIVQFLNGGQEATVTPSYTELRQQLKDNNVAEITGKFDGYAYLVTGKYRDIVGNEKTKNFSLYIPYDTNVLKEITDLSEQNGFEVTWKKMPGESIWVTFLTSIVPLAIMFILFFFLFNQAQGGGGKVMNFGKSRARLYNEEKKKVTFEDVAGADEEKQELVEVVEFLKDPRKFSAVGARIPKAYCW